MLLQHTSKANIKAWQTFLNQQNCGPIATDGIWGSGTTAASKKFQTANDLTADGLIGSGTIAKATAKGLHLPDPMVAPKATVPANNSNNVFDIAHGNVVNPNGFQAAYAGGMRMVFHKATGGFKTVKFHDNKYAERRPKAEAAGLLWGAYHFANGYESGTDQAKGFLDFLKANGGVEKTLMVLDYEPDEVWQKVDGQMQKKEYKDMNLQQARDFVNYIHQNTGVYPLIYGAHNKLFKDLVAENVPASDVLYQCPLWYAQYSTSHVPDLSNVHWNSYAFWQYTDGSHGSTPGMKGKVDRSFYNLGMGSLEAFHAQHTIENRA